ncbi:MAG: hypothetical protein NTZ67_01430 [Gammaproteobacteria bacterium]|nr:hypothetical protein [Gammaproteobacteria bacterium]
MLAVKSQLLVLENEIAALSASNEGKTNSFSVIYTLFHSANALINKNKISVKNQKKNVLNKMAALLQHHLETKTAISQEKITELQWVMKDNNHWNDGLMSKRTVKLVERARGLLL